MPMSLLSATVLRVRPVGVTGDFCPVCRQERRFRLAQAEYRRVVLLVDRGRAGQEHHELLCKSCGCVVERPASERPIPHALQAPARRAAEAFEPECLPIVRHRIDDCTRMEALRKSGKVRPETREEMIRHAIHCFARIYDEPWTARITPLASAALFSATLASCVLSYLAWTRLDHPWLAFGVLLGAAVLWIGLWHWVNTHSPRARVRMWLAMALAPLDPTEAEIRQARMELQTHRMGAGFKMSPAKLRGHIDRIRRSGMVPG